MTRTITLDRLLPVTMLWTRLGRDVGASFERFCLTAGIAALGEMMEEDARRLAARGMAAATARRATAGAGRQGKVGFHGGKVDVRSAAGAQLARP